MHSPIKLEWTDGVIFLRPLQGNDAAEHLSGEDEEIAKWLSGGRSTLANVQAYIADCQFSWRSHGPRWAFGIFDGATGRLIGSIEAKPMPILEPGQVNVSYGVFRPWRGRGIAGRALALMSEYLRAATDMRQMVLRIAPTNVASIRVAKKADFTAAGVFQEPEGATLLRFVRLVKVG